MCSYRQSWGPTAIRKPRHLWPPIGVKWGLSLGKWKACLVGITLKTMSCTCSLFRGSNGCVHLGSMRIHVCVVESRYNICAVDFWGQLHDQTINHKLRLWFGIKLHFFPGKLIYLTSGPTVQWDPLQIAFAKHTARHRGRWRKAPSSTHPHSRKGGKCEICK